MNQPPDSQPSTPLLVLLWSDRPIVLSEAQCAWLEPADAIWVLGSTIAGTAYPQLEGTPAHLRDVLAPLARAYPNADLLLFNAALQTPEDLLTRLAALRQQPDCPEQVAVPGNYAAVGFEIDPLRGLITDQSPQDISALVALCGDGRWQPLNQAPLDCLLLQSSRWVDRPDRIGLDSAVLIDDAYVCDPTPRDDTQDMDYQPPLGHVRLRASRGLREGQVKWPSRVPSGKPVTLHIAHSWGGGVWRWIEDHMAGDPDTDHLVLVAVSDTHGQRCGRSLQLCVDGPGRGVIREFELSPDIISTVNHHPSYEDHLNAILKRFSVDRIIVSSLIGHSLDCLRTGLPTLQMLHDFYPVWPFLDYDPMPWIEAEQGIDWVGAFDAYANDMRMRPKSASAWQALGQAWQQQVAERAIELMAPTQHVIERWQAMTPGQTLRIEHQPHGFRPFDRALAESRPCNLPSTDPRLHLLIPGRLSAGKGMALLREALPKLRPFARITALGCGKEGLSLMGQTGVDLIKTYQREQLPELIELLQPDAVLLLSTVPETWNYTLSEMRALHRLPVATRLGSFAERIEHGVDGFLIEPNAEALIKQIEWMVQHRSEWQGMTAQVPQERSLSEQAQAITQRLPIQPRVGPDYAKASIEQAEYDRSAAALADAEQRALRADAQRSKAQQVLTERSEWAQTMERQFQQRSRWVDALKRDTQALERTIEDHQAWLDDAEHNLAQTQRTLQDVRDELDQVIHQREQVQASLDVVYASRSWRVTRPLRVFNRLLANARRNQVYNPQNWSDLIQAFLHQWRMRGLRQALVMLQQAPVEHADPDTTEPTVVPRADRVLPPVQIEARPRPTVSIIIPVFNQLHFTAACIHSVLKVNESVSFELIVVNDASSDETEPWLRQCRGLRVVHNEVNLGFIGSCNRGAEDAQGEFLLFLNNDTMVTDHWLSALVDTFDEQDQVGIVGSKLIYADGALQEAGGIIFRDGSGWNYGRNQQADRPEYSFVSEADYVSGASLMIRRVLFEQLNGFDVHYSPAYYEDTDLCFRVRQSGRTVLYQPASTVIHFEGVTSGTDEASGAKQYQAINRDKFIERWRSVLEQQPEQALRESRQDIVRHHRYHRLPQRVLVVDAVTPMPDQDSGSVRVFALMKILLKLGYQTSFMPHNLAWAGRDSTRLQQAGIEVLTAPWVNDIEQWLDEHGQELDLIIVSRHYVLRPLLKLMRHYCPNARLVFDTVDLHFLREQREAELNQNAAVARAAARTRRDELRLIDQVDATLVVSEFEAALLGELKPEARVQVVSNIHALNDPGSRWAERHDLMFVGGFQHPPNVDAVEWLVNDILPLIRAELPEVRLHVIGSKMPGAIRDLQAPGLVVHGFVADLEPYLTSVRVSLAPLRYGAGVKGKVNQAMSHGLPVVATTCAAEGMYTQHEHDVLMADDAEAFAREVVRVYREEHLWNRLAVNGRDNVEQHFSMAAAQRALVELLGSMDAVGVHPPEP
ncbi:MAG: glycosyltransferase [Pseudomonadota bacterium]